MSHSHKAAEHVMAGQTRSSHFNLHCILGGFSLDFTWILADLYGLVKKK